MRFRACAPNLSTFKQIQTACIGKESEAMSILMVTGIEGAGNCAAAIAASLGQEVEVAGGRRQALAALRRREYEAVVVDETIAECDPAAAEAVWQHSGLATPLAINFALCGAARIEREIRAALSRREREKKLAERAAAVSIETGLKSALAGLLLHAELATKSPDLPPAAAERLRTVAELALSLRQQLQPQAAGGRQRAAA
jgi:hypothetical protein